MSGNLSRYIFAFLVHGGIPVEVVPLFKRVAECGRGRAGAMSEVRTRAGCAIPSGKVGYV